MTNGNHARATSAKRRAQELFTKTERHDSAFRREREQARAADAAKTSRLRALRTAKEAADKEQMSKSSSKEARR